MRPRTARNIECGVAFVAAGAVLIWVPGQWFLELAMAMLVGSILGVWGLKKYIDRLHKTAVALEKSDRPEEATVLRVRRLMIIDAGVLLGVVGLTAFIGLLVVYAD